MVRQWTTDEIIAAGRGFQAACVLTAAAELDLFTALDEGARDAGSVAGRLGADERATRVVLDALVALEVLSKQGDQYALAPETARLLSRAGGGNVLAMLRHQGTCLRRWSQLARVVRDGGPAPRAESILDEAAEQVAFIEAMHNFSSSVAAETVGRLGPLDFAHLLDVGGASGTWTIEFLKAVPGARATLFDLPSVIPMAERRISQAGFAERVDLVAGDFYQDDLPGGADLAFLGAIAHQNSRQQNRELFGKVRAALEPGGVVVIRDVVMDRSHTEPRAGALFAVNMLVATPGGGTYSFEEYSEDLRASGFGQAELVYRDEFMESLIRARKE